MASPTGTTTGSTSTGTFSTDAQNDSAIYNVNGAVLCRELVPTNYTINGSSQIYSTTRVYCPYSMYNGATGQGASSIYVIFGGFIYNQSSGFSFDPAVIAYNSGSNSSSGSNLFNVVLPISAVAAVAVVAIGALIMVKRRRTEKAHARN
jgi:hypothetical protein